MKRKELTDLKNKEIKDLIKMAAEKKFEAKKVRLNISGGKEKNLKMGKNIRRDIAQILTIVKEKGIMEKLAPKAK